MMGVIIKNEFFKLSKQKKPLVFLILILLFVCGGAFIISKVGSDVPPANEVFKTLTMAMSQIIIIFGILTVTECMTEDCKNGTIKMSTVQPVNRSVIFLGKFIYVAITIVLMYLLVEVISFIATSIFIGVPTMNMVGEVLKAIGLSSIVITSFLSIVALLGVLFSAPSLVTSLGIVILFLSDIVISLLPLVKWIPKDTQYFFVTQYFTKFFGKLPEINNIELYATIAIGTPLVLCTLGAIKVFQRKELHF